MGIPPLIRPTPVGNVSDDSVRSHQMAYCDRCERTFPHDWAYEQHRSNSHAHWLCDSCDIDFASEDSLDQHYGNSPKHHYCKDCERHFDSVKSKMQHMEAKHWYCETHNRIFDSENSLKSHCRQSGDHIYCVECEMNFDDDDEWWGHLEEEHHACAPCRKRFGAKKQLEQHDRDVHHVCTECSRFFRTAFDARQHANSGVHQQAAPTLRCPGADCGRTFVSPSALAGHFESGACASRMTRDQLDRLVVRADRKNYVTQRWATGRMWNGAAYECPLCDDASFDRPEQLSQHLQSPRHAHADNLYKCPEPSCASEFGTLSALWGHVESGSCGAGSFRRVRKAMDNWTRRLQV
ncbi:hypothetical protein EDB86DRAFT_3046177 [Lactarius hatsudake]|nr:hypothetical protein EDB86DRAFT_3046177 [Lactarius hatsudake]